MKSILKLIERIIKFMFPKSRWGNIFYLLIGYVIANWESIMHLLNSLGLSVK